MTAPLVVLASLAVAWALTVAWAHHQRVRSFRRQVDRITAALIEASRSTSDFGEAVKQADRAITRLYATYISGMPLDEELP